MGCHLISAFIFGLSRNKPWFCLMAACFLLCSFCFLFFIRHPPSAMHLLHQRERERSIKWDLGEWVAGDKREREKGRNEGSLRERTNRQLQRLTQAINLPSLLSEPKFIRLIFSINALLFSPIFLL